ncbi:MAG: response regulator [Anaerolineae bacterium]|nr:response regulator [Anaerolineae bacterium]
MSKTKEQSVTSLRVLIADDTQQTRRSTRLMLTLIPGVEVVAMAQNGREAVELAHKYRPDVALMDVNMPELDGITAIKAMRQILPDLVCLVISAERDNRTLRAAMVAGAQDYLIKPFTTEELQDAIQRVRPKIRTGQNQLIETEKIRHQRDAYLKQLADEYAKARRTDDKALHVFEELAGDPQCDPRWLMHLATIYLMRREWGKLKLLSERLEKVDKGQPLDRVQ